MWRPTMLLLCLIAALSGTMLRQAEAAADFARSRAEFGPGHVVEMIDGGVGDDSGATILNTGGDAHATPATIALATADAFLTTLQPAASRSLPNVGDRRRADRLALLPAGPARQHAWLQCFLF